MAQADLLVRLLKSATNNDQQTFRKTAEELIQEERSRGHRILADRLHKSIQPDLFQGARTVFPKTESGNGRLKELAGLSPVIQAEINSKDSQL
jgi:hypothetical protein